MDRENGLGILRPLLCLIPYRRSYSRTCPQHSTLKLTIFGASCSLLWYIIYTSIQFKGYVEMKERTILIVEDDRALIDVLKYNLEKEGYNVSTALNSNNE